MLKLKLMSTGGNNQNAEKIVNIEHVETDNFNINFGASHGFTMVGKETYEGYVAPEITENLLIDHLTRSPFLIVSADFTFDKGGLLRQLALQSSLTSGKPLSEWRGGSDDNGLFRALRDLSESSVLVIDDLEPRDIQYDLPRLYKEVTSKGHILLAGTNVPKVAWHLQGSLDQLFLELDESKISYSKESLRKLLAQEIGDYYLKLALNKVDETSHDQVLIGRTSLNDLVDYFSTPEQIEVFIRLLSSLAGEISEDELLQMAQKASTEEKFSLAQWFASLSEKEQMIALAMTLFEGFTEGQFFESLYELAEDSWGKRVPELQAVDYSDISFLMHTVFKRETVGEEQVLVARYPQQQLCLLEAAWSSHRRHILKAFPVMVRLVINSIRTTIGTSDLYNTKARRQRVRSAVGRSLSVVGYISVDTVQPYLLELASNNEVGVQIVAAKALAQWRQPLAKHLKAPDLFAILKAWQSETRFEQWVSHYLGKSNEYTAINSIRATVILTLGYAAQYDPPKYRNKELIELMASFYTDKTPWVRMRLDNAIPHIIRVQGLYLTEDEWQPLLAQGSLLPSVARGLSWAYLDNPSKVESFLREMLFGKDLLGDSEIVDGYTGNDRWIGLLIHTLGDLMVTVGSDVMIGERRALDWVWELRDNQTHPALKQKAWEVQIRHGALVQNDTSEIEKRLKDISKKEEGILVAGLGKLYLKQRSELEGGDERSWKDGVAYQLWTHTDRPELEIETLMYTWLDGKGRFSSKDKDHQRMIQQIAFLAFQQFAKVFEYWESNEIEERKKALAVRLAKERKIQREREDPAKDTALIPLNEGLAQRVINSIFSTEKSRLIQGINNLIANTAKVNPEYMRLVIVKWKRKKGIFKKAAESVETALRNAENLRR